MAWLDPERSGKFSAAQLQAALPGLSDADAADVAALDQTAAQQHYMWPIDGRYWYKVRARSRTTTVLRQGCPPSSSLKSGADHPPHQ